MSKYIHKRCITVDCKKFSTNPVERAEGQEEVHHCKDCLKLLKLEKPKECPICYDEEVQLKQLKPCGHWICQSCLDHTVKRDVCSFCRCTIQLTKEERTKYEIDKVADKRQGWVNISLDMDLNLYAQHLRQGLSERQARRIQRNRREQLLLERALDIAFNLN